jgi:hypothetical protein
MKRKKRLMKLSVFGEYDKFTVVGITRTHLGIRLMNLSAFTNALNEIKRFRRMRRMKLSALGEKCE